MADPVQNDAPSATITPSGSATAPQGKEIRVNSAVANDQQLAQITTLANGGFVVTWTDDSLGVGGTTGDNSDRAVKAQVFTPDGDPIGDEILVNTATASFQDRPQITALPGGGFVIVWRDLSKGVGGATGDNSGYAVKAQVFADDGTPLGGEILVNTATANDQTFPSIVTLSNGGFVIAWTDFSLGVGGTGGDTSGAAVKAQLYDFDGTPLGDEILVNSATVNAQSVPVLAALAGGGFVVTWMDDSQGVGGATGDSQGLAVKAQIFDSDGDPVGDEILVNTAVQGGQDNQRVTALSNGGFVVTWEDDSAGFGGATGDNSLTAIKAQIFAADGTAVGGEILVNSATSSLQGDPRVAALANGGFVVAWSDLSQGVGGATGDTSVFAIKAQIFAGDGARIGGEILVNTAVANSQLSPQVVTLSSGGFVITWQDESQGVGGATGDASNLAVKAQAFLADGTRVGSEILVNSATQSDQYSPQITALANDGFAIVWTDFSQGVGGADGDSSGLAVKAQLFGPGSYQATEQVPLNLKGTLAVADPDAGSGIVTATLAVDFGLLHLESGSSGATIGGNDSLSVTITGTLAQINALFGSDPTSVVTYTPNSETPPASATLTLSVDDGGNSGTGGALTGSDSAAIYIQALAYPPGHIDGDGGDNVLVGTPGPDFFVLSQGGDDDVDGAGGNDVFLFGAALTSADKVNGNAGVDQLAIQGDYPNLVLGTGVVSIESLALLPASDSRFGGGSASPYDYAVTTVDENVAAGARLSVDANRLGAEEDFTFDGSAETDGSFFIFGGGGDDHLTGGARNDVFLFGAEGQWGAGDSVDGGAGLDQLVLRGDYAIEFGAGQLAGIESIALVSAHDTRFGALGLNFNYDLTMDDGNVAAGAQMVVDGTNLRSSERLMFDGNAEQDGSFRVYGGAGDDRIHGSAGDDLLAGGGGKDYLIGGAGADTHLVRSVAESTGTGYDTLGDFIYTSDTIDLPGTHDSYQSLVGGTVNSASFDADMTAAMEGVLDPFEAVIFSVFGGDQSDRVFLIVDQNGIAGHQSGEDFVFEIQGTAPPQGPVYPDFIV